MEYHQRHEFVNFLIQNIRKIVNSPFKIPYIEGNSKVVLVLIFNF